MDNDLLQLTLQVRNRKDNDSNYAKFHGDHLIGDKIAPSIGLGGDLKAIFCTLKNWPAIGGLIGGYLTNGTLNAPSLAQIAGSLSSYSRKRQGFIDQQVKDKYDRMLHPPLTYLGDAFQYRTADGKFNSVINPHLGQAGAPYAKTVPSKTAPLGALPDPSDLFDKLMARKDGGRESQSGLSSMLIYHATIIIHDIFRTNENDKNISDSSSYLDLSPLYGYTDEMQRKIRDDTYKLGFLKPDAFAEDRLLRQPPGVCIMLVMYNRYHNYAAKQLYRINENGRFSVPKKYADTKLVSVAKNFYGGAEMPIGMKNFEHEFWQLCKNYNAAWEEQQASSSAIPATNENDKTKSKKIQDKFKALGAELEGMLTAWGVQPADRKKFEAGYDAAWTKLDDDLFNTARLITCGMYIQVSVHDYLRALMGFHQFDTNFTLDPRADFDQRKTTRGIGNQVTVEFNLLYRFHCAISLKDEAYTEEFFRLGLGIEKPADISLQEFLMTMGKINKDKVEREAREGKPDPAKATFGIPNIPDPKNPKKDPHPQSFLRNEVTGLFDDQQMVNALRTAMDDPISNFGPCNVPRSLKSVEVMGIAQARKWECGTLNDFRDFFGMHRHETFESVTKNVEIQNALRDLYEHPDKIELYPGIFCESDEYMGLDPGPSKTSSALWAAIFSDAITLVRSDRFYTVDWNTNSLTSWGMNEVTPNNEICKSSVFHRLIQRAFPGWFQYDSVRFFHPFYTSETNERYAREQGYSSQLKLKPEPAKPKKPVHLDNFEDISLVLKETRHFLTHPALLHPGYLPKQMQEVLQPKYKRSTFTNVFGGENLENEPALLEYLDNLMRSVVKRESVAMTNSTFQIDATRDFAIPIVTRYVADFLGFGHLLRTETNSSGKFSENEIYEHITNCQTFLSYNADETKMLKRGKAFKKSADFLIDLTLHANIATANQWYLTKVIFGSKRSNAMNELGFKIAQKILNFENHVGKAAAILLLVCLDFAYNSVVSFTAVLDELMYELYEAADHPQGKDAPPPTWLEVQALSFGKRFKDQRKLEKIVAQRELEKIVEKTARKTVRLPIIRLSATDFDYASDSDTRVASNGHTSNGHGANGHVRNGRISNGNEKERKAWDKKVEQNQVVIINLQEATIKAEKCNQRLEVDYLDEQQSNSANFSAYMPRRFGTLALTAMIKFIARMKNPRRGHDAQGKLKQLHLDYTAEGYSNFMAPMRMDMIAQTAERLPLNDKNKNIFTEDVLRPATDTYLTPSWDEMVPFPMTWKIRYDGFGPSDYSGTSATGKEEPYGRIKSAWIPDDAPPWYQPQGLSTIGGSFADTRCTCGTSCHKENKEKGSNGISDFFAIPKAAEEEPTLSTGCGLYAGK